jgi:uncharacterized protein (DUF433 family)
LLTPNEVAALAETSKTIVEKALEQNILGARAGRRLQPLHAVALAATAKILGRRLSVNDKKRVAREIASMSPAALKTAEIEVAPSLLVRIGSLTRAAVDRAERYAAARDAYIEIAEGVQGGRPVIKGTRLTVSAIYGRLSSGDTLDTLVEDYPEIPREAFEAAFLFAKTHPRVGRPTSRRAAKTV